MYDPDDKYVDMMYDIDPTLIYITTSITNEATAINSYCTCEKCDSNCECIKKSGINYSEDGLLNIISDKVAFECNFQCKCTNHLNCTNRVTTKLGTNKNLIIKAVLNKNYGVFSTESILKGSFICEYAGEIINEQEAKERREKYREMNVCNYIFCLREINIELNKEQVTIVDPTAMGNVGRFINHSCEPNCMIIPIRCDNIHPKLCIFTKRDVLNDEEITFDYGSHFETNKSESDAENRIICCCNSGNCKIYLPFHE